MRTLLLLLTFSKAVLMTVLCWLYNSYHSQHRTHDTAPLLSVFFVLMMDAFFQGGDLFRALFTHLCSLWQGSAWFKGLSP